MSVVIFGGAALLWVSGWIGGLDFIGEVVERFFAWE